MDGYENKHIEDVNIAFLLYAGSAMQNHDNWSSRIFQYRNVVEQKLKKT